MRLRNCKSVFLLLLEEFEMHYEEKLIEGVLHWREPPNGEWKPMTREKLTAIVLELRRLVQLNTPWTRFCDSRQPVHWPPQPIVTCKDSASE